MSPDHWAVNAGLVVTSALALIANALLLLVFCRRRGLRTVSNRFVINLLVTNLLSSVVLIPLLLVDHNITTTITTPSSLSAETTEEHLIIMKDYNNSARMEIENILMESNHPHHHPEFIPENHVSSSDEIKSRYFNEKISELELPENKLQKIRHEHHLLKLQNESLHHQYETSSVLSVLLSIDRNDTSNDFSTTFLCYLSGGSTSLVCTASILSILLIAIDQYFAVTHPLRYHAFIDKVKSVILLVSTWLLSLLFGILGSFVQTESSVWNFCGALKQNEYQDLYNVIYAFTYFILVILLPFLVICVIYGCIYCAAHRNSERMRKSNSGSSNTNLDAYIQIPLDDNNKLKVKVNSSDNVTSIMDDSDAPRLPKVKSAPNFANLEKTKLNMPIGKFSDDKTSTSAKVSHANSLRSNASFINSLKTKISNASLFKYREETRAAKISILVIFMVLVCYVPYGLALVMNTNLIYTSPRYFNCISLSLLVSANFLSPFLFAYRNRRIRRELRRLFGLVPASRSGLRELSVIGQRSSFRCNNRATSCVYKPKELKELVTKEPFLAHTVIPEVVVTCKMETEKKSILKRVCSKGKTWGNVKRCNFISVPECLSTECRCSFSSASTQVSSEEYSVCN